ncbi:lamin tail domain-containing protein [Candidatus Omnitrophota bacterium]
MIGKRVRGVCLVWLVLIAVICTVRAEAAIFISEVLSDPPSGIMGDANGDGVTSSSKDEFVELFNDGVDVVDLSGWSLFDAVKVRHIFEQGFNLNAYTYALVFGSTASSGGLSLNNTGDHLTLFDANGFLVDQMTFGREGGKDQSLARINEGGNVSYQLHSTLSEAEGRLFSPGSDVTGAIPVFDAPPQGVPPTVTPEPATALLMGVGVFLLGVLKQKWILTCVMEEKKLL